MLRVNNNDCTGEIKEEFTGKHVILSVEEYNTLVRQLNNLTILVMELMTPENRNTNRFLELLLKNKLQIEE